jgi:hypothetical protein
VCRARTQGTVRRAHLTCRRARGGSSNEYCQFTEWDGQGCGAVLTEARWCTLPPFVVGRPKKARCCGPAEANRHDDKADFITTAARVGKSSLATWRPRIEAGEDVSSMSNTVCHKQKKNATKSVLAFTTKQRAHACMHACMHAPMHACIHASSLTHDTRVIA